MTAYVRSRGVENSAGLWMRVEGSDGKGNYSVSSNLMRTPIKGTTDWKRCEVVLDVPKEGAAAIYFGVMLAGKGQVWADDFKFEAVGKEVRTTGGRVETGKASGGPLKRLPTEPRNLDFEQPSPEPEIKSDPPPAAAGKPTPPRAGPPKGPGAGLKIEAGAKGMKVRAAGLQGDALRISYEDTSGVLVLEGTREVPATLIRSAMGQGREVRAIKIIYSPTDDTLRAESVNTLRSDP
jgi:hypothetical protein